MASTEDRFGLVGTVVADKYVVERQVGEGGFGVVYRAQHKIWDQPVAIKCFTALSNAPREYRDQLLDLFVQEGKLLSSLSSRTAAIVQARDIGTLTTPTGVWLPYMVLEWLDGVSLDRLIKRDGQPIGETRSAAEVFQLLDGAARALALAHVQNVAHRDIKPENFFVIGARLVPGAVIKVLDFGIAKVMQSQAQTAMHSTGYNVSSFTPNYGAPEQFDRTHGATGPWTDVFGMALVFVEIMRGGKPVLDGETFLQLAFASQNPDRRPTPRALGIEVSDAVEAVFARAFAVKVVDRFRTMGEFWAALAGALEISEFPPMPSADAEADDAAIASAGTSGARRALTSSSPSQPFLPATNARTTQTSAYGAGAGVGVGVGGTVVSQERRALTEAYGQGETLVAPPTTLASAPPPPADPPRSRAALIGVAGALVVSGLAAYLALGKGKEAPPEPTPPAAAATEVVAKETPPEPAKVDEPPPPPCPEGMAYIEGGTFFMGTDADNPVLALARPAHKVEVAPYCLDITEVTVAAYRECSNEGKCKRAYRDAFWPRGKTPTKEWERLRSAHDPLCNERYDDRNAHPINCVTWKQANDYCAEIGKRLPTEAEWEFAARGSDGRVYPWGDETPSPEHLNACGSECVEWRVSAGIDPGTAMYDADDGNAATAPVGSYRRGKTQAGLLDMVGNVFEWTADPFLPYGTGEGEAPVANNKRVIRGGAFNSVEPEHTDPALRYPQDADAHPPAIGFRCAASPLAAG
ncbi:MAG: SUMF1/EgtB/PvdO family nonheme iron enzyme [Myxococcales bacterium]|nr:SUMF1/EgtB/PvdO family nonheme iron enzyme [Myxococcales bacterium]